jgi:nicotinamidase-related amidase
MPSVGQTVIDEWQNVRAPAAPQIKTVTIEPKSTALLMIDLIRQTCNSEKAPRCIASIPRIQKLLAEARASRVTVIYTLFPHSVTGAFPNPVIGDTLPAVAPRDGEPVVTAFVDKFILGDKDTGLQKMLNDKGISTIIPVGTVAHGGVLFTSVAAALRGFGIVLPVDGMSSDGQAGAYEEQATTHILTHSVVYSSKITLTSTDGITFAH